MSGAAAAAAPLLGAGASSGAVMGAAGGIAAKLAGLGMAKAAVLVVAATSVVAYGGVQAGKVVPDARPASAPQVATMAHTPSPAPSSDLAQASPAMVPEADAAAAGAQAVERLRGSSGFFAGRPSLSGDPRLMTQVKQLSLVLVAGGGLAGADALRQWNSAHPRRDAPAPQHRRRRARRPGGVRADAGPAGLAGARRRRRR